MHDKPFSLWRRLPWRAALCAGAMIAAPIDAFGGEWTADYSSLISATYNDNPSLVTDNAKSRTDFTVNRAVDAKYAQDRYSIDIIGQANLVASKKEIAKGIFSKDQVRYDLNVGGNYDFETSVIAAAFGIGFDTVQNTEFADTGILTTGVTRTNKRLNLNYNKQLSDTLGFNISDDVTVVSYSGGNFTGYRNNSLLLGFSNAYSERLTLTPSIGYSRYTPDSPVLKSSNTVRLQVGGRYELSDKDSLGVTIGGLQTDRKLGWSALVDYRQEVGDGLVVSANVNRDNVPSGAGNVRQSTGFGGGLTYQFAESMNVGVDASWRTSSQVGASGSADTTQYQVAPSLNWTINEKWRAGLNLQNRHQKRPQSGAATSNSMTVVFNYNLPAE